MAVVTTPSMGAVVTIPHMGPTEELETVDLTPTTPEELESDDTFGSSSGVADVCNTGGRVKNNDHTEITGVGDINLVTQMKEYV